MSFIQKLFKQILLNLFFFKNVSLDIENNGDS